MQWPSGTAFSVRGLASAGAAVLAALCVAIAAAVLWVALLLQGTSNELVRDAESLRLVTRIELELLNFQRFAASGDDSAVPAELESTERALQQALERSMEYAAGPVEIALITRATEDIEAYLRRRAELEGGGAAGAAVRAGARPLLNRALSTLNLLREANETEVADAYARAQRAGRFLIGVAIGAIVFACAVLLLTSVAVHKMLLQPILGLRETIERFRAGERSASADEKAPRELREIARAFNEMSAELGRQRAHQLAFVAGIAHDLRNPLGALRFSVEAMRARRAWPDEETERIVAMLARQIDHLSHMVGDLLETTSIEAGELLLNRETFDLRCAVEAVLELYDPVSADRRLDVDLGDAPALVYADRTRIEQVAGNLLNNAIKYSAPGGRITVSVTSSGESVELSVSDDGVGISEQHLESVFRPFWRAGGSAAGGGTGLGLSVVHRIIVAHGGSVDVESAPGSGSTFRVRLPAGEPDAAETELADVRRAAATDRR